VKKKLIIGLSFLTCVFVSYAFYGQSQKILSQEITSWVEDQRADCAVVLTGGPGRVREGFDLLTQGRIRKLIISGVYPQAELRDIFPQWPYYGPMEEDDVILEKRSATTYGNAQQSLPLVEALRCRDIILVTSRLHMHRSFKIFRAVFPAEIPITSRAIVAGRAKPTNFELFVETTKAIFYSIWAY
jgi:uncharacterized SAM-binding protein YcdF (DUF218 family)